MLAQLVTALLAFASRVKLEDPKDYTPLPTRTVYSTQSVDPWGAALAQRPQEACAHGVAA